MKLQHGQEELESQLRQKQHEIERLKAELTKRENEDRAKQTGALNLPVVVNMPCLEE